MISPKFSEILLGRSISEEVNTILNRLRKVLNPLKENCVKGNIILDLWAFKDSPSGNPSEKNLAVLFHLTEGFMVCLRVKTILFSV